MRKAGFVVRFVSPNQRAMLVPALMKLGTLPITGLASILQARLVTEWFGIESFAIFTIVASLPLLLPTPDLGTGASITNAAAVLPVNSVRFVTTLIQAVVRISVVSTIIVIAVLAVGVCSSWSEILGFSSGGYNWPIAISLVAFCTAMPLSIGTSILVGLSRVSTVVLTQCAVPLIGIVTLLCVGLFDLDFSVALSLSTIGLSASLLVGTVIAFRDARVVRAAKAWAFYYRQNRRNSKVERVLVGSVSTIIITFVLPISFQTGRLVLSWFGDLNQVAQFSALMIVFLPVYSVVQISGRSLWPRFASERAREMRSNKSFWSGFRTAVFVGFGGGAGLCLLGPTIVSWAVGDAVMIPRTLYFIFGLIVVVQAMHLPGGMFLTDGPGLRFQAVTTSGMAITVLGLSCVLTPPFGALGPALALLAGLFCLQFLPCFVYSLKRIYK
ncbi:hypothetical protein [Rhodococcoides fascians]|uniref:hypothetical protein n=1 Tax=Rhodococcoides fascians TaxID=1828 RepID=UPI0037A121D5